MNIYENETTLIPEHKISGVIKSGPDGTIEFPGLFSTIEISPIVIKSGPNAVLFTIQCVDKSIFFLKDFALDFMTLTVHHLHIKYIKIK